MNYIKVRTQFDGLHRWEDAPDEVDFLRNPHRHMFHVSVKMEVKHQTRELEFFIMQKEVNALIQKWKNNIGTETESCEQIAQWLVVQLTEQYGERFIEVEVSEDGENSGIVNNQEDNQKDNQDE